MCEFLCVCVCVLSVNLCTLFCFNFQIPVHLAEANFCFVCLFPGSSSITNYSTIFLLMNCSAMLPPPPISNIFPFPHFPILISICSCICALFAICLSPLSVCLSVYPLKRIELIAVCFGFLQALHNCGTISYRNVC